ncbi:MAG: DUF2341 domain-containing protein [Chitinispirillaceae bacterium]|nr:DUF2341 domain-containing protein [Chitinispirillaceae bacterium]
MIGAARILALSLALLSVVCSPLSLDGTGSGGEARTALVSGTVLYDGGVPVDGARVVVRPQNYLSGISEFYNHEESATDDRGVFSISVVDSGDYCIEVNDGISNAVIIRFHKNVSDTIVSLPPDTLRPTGVIHGTIQTASGESQGARVFIYGLERSVETASPEGGFVIEDVPQNSYSIVIVSPRLGYTSQTVEAVNVASGSATDVGMVRLSPTETWAYSKKIVLNTAASGAGIAGNVVNFPVLIRLSAASFSFDQTSPDGADLRFARADSTLLPCEIERWDGVAGRADIWVKVDTVYGADSTQYITMFWGGSHREDHLSVFGSVDVFDTRDGFRGVWHLGSSVQSLLPDATRNRYHGTPKAMGAASSVAGAIGLARRFDGEASHIIMNGTARSALDFGADATYAVSAWVNVDLLNGRHRIIASKGNKQYNLQIKNTDSWEFAQFRDTPSDSVGWEETITPAQSGAWVYITGIRSGTRQLLYVDGVCVDSSITLYPLKVEDTQRSRDQTRDFAIGRLPDGPSYFFPGKIDEVRVMGVEPTQDWIRLCYMNQKANDKLVVFK